MYDSGKTTRFAEFFAAWLMREMHFSVVFAPDSMTGETWHAAARKREAIATENPPGKACRPTKCFVLWSQTEWGVFEYLHRCWWIGDVCSSTGLLLPSLNSCSVLKPRDPLYPNHSHRYQPFRRYGFKKTEICSYKPINILRISINRQKQSMKVTWSVPVTTLATYGWMKIYFGVQNEWE